MQSRNSAKLTHGGLLLIMNRFGYKGIDIKKNSDKNEVGVCYGYSEMLANALGISNPEAEKSFYRRMDILAQCINITTVSTVGENFKLIFEKHETLDEEKFNILFNKINSVKEKIKSGMQLEGQEFDYKEIEAFLDGVYLSQCELDPSLKKRLFETEVSQRKNEEVINLVKSIELEQEGGLKCISELNYSFDVNSLELYFENLASILQLYPGSVVNLSLAKIPDEAGVHAVIAQFDSLSNMWKYFDINDLSRYEMDTYFRLLNAKDLAESLVESGRFDQMNSSDENKTYGITIRSTNKAFLNDINEINKVQNLQKIDINKEANIIFSVLDTNIDKLEKFLLEREDINKQFANQTALSVACSKNCKNISIVDEKIFDILLNLKEINVNQQVQGALPLAIAASKGNVYAVNALLKHKDIDVNKTNELNNLPSISACVSRKDVPIRNHIDIIKALIGAGANLKWANPNDETPLFSFMTAMNFLPFFTEIISVAIEKDKNILLFKHNDMTLLDMAVAHESEIIKPQKTRYKTNISSILSHMNQCNLEPMSIMSIETLNILLNNKDKYLDASGLKIIEELSKKIASKETGIIQSKETDLEKSQLSKSSSSSSTTVVIRAMPSNESSRDLNTIQSNDGNNSKSEQSKESAQSSEKSESSPKVTFHRGR